MPIEPKPCANGCGKLIKNQGVHNRYCLRTPPGKMKLPLFIQPEIPKESLSSSADKNSLPPKAKVLKEIDKPIVSTHDTSKPSFWEKFKSKPKPEIKEVLSPEELIQGLKSYQIPDSNPKTGFGKISNRNKDFIQVVLVSKLIEPKTFWAEKTGMNRIQHKDRMYKLPRDIRGNVFFWDIDKKEPLVDSADASQADAESSFHELQLFNMAYSVGRAAGANDLLNNLKLILIITGFMCFLVIITLIYLNRIDKAMGADDATIINMLNTINQTVSVTH